MRESVTLVRWISVLSLLGCVSLAACGSSSPGASGHGGTGDAAGAAGTTGAAGASGASGTTGEAGSGAAGTTGVSGTTGTGGATGGAGATGSAGRGGASGAAGTTGAAGTIGAAGASGRGGAAGSAGRGGGAGTAGTAGAGTGGAAVMPSAGCSATTTPAAGRTTIDVSGTPREYILTLPTNYDPKHPYRLIVAFHGGQYNDDWLVQGDAPQSGPYYGIESEANNQAIFVASQALSGSWVNTNNQDIDYVVAMVTRFKAELCIDENRIFATGFSMGGIMTNTVGCVEPTVFRAIAAMSGRLPTTPATCTPSHEIAYWASHGMSDPTIAIADGQKARDKFVALNHCTGPGSSPDSNGCITYQGCDAAYPVMWCPFDGVHQPPPFAGAAIWKFLSQF